MGELIGVNEAALRDDAKPPRAIGWKRRELVLVADIVEGILSAEDLARAKVELVEVELDPQSDKRLAGLDVFSPFRVVIAGCELFGVDLTGDAYNGRLHFATSGKPYELVHVLFGEDLGPRRRLCSEAVPAVVLGRASSH